MLQFTFDFPKAFQAAGVVLREHRGTMNFIRLLKLLYVADRELLARTGRPLTGDEALALAKGPAPRTIHNLINGRGGDAVQARWNEAFLRDGDDVSLLAPVPAGRLTRAEEMKLIEVCERYRETSTEELCDRTHDFGEWREAFVPDEANPINWEVALEDQGAGSLVREVRHLQQEAESFADALRE